MHALADNPRSSCALENCALAPSVLDAVRVLFVRHDEEAYEHAWGAHACAAGPWAELRVLACEALPEHPLAYQDYRHFHNLVLTPGIPGAVLPVESLYKDWETGRLGTGGTQGLYLGPSARHIQELCRSLEIQIPPRFEATPDHLVLLLELHAFLAEHAGQDQARTFATEHLDWLGAFADALAARCRDANDDASLAQAGDFFAGILRFIDNHVNQRACRQGALAAPEGRRADAEYTKERVLA